MNNDKRHRLGFNIYNDIVCVLFGDCNHGDIVTPMIRTIIIVAEARH